MCSPGQTSLSCERVAFLVRLDLTIHELDQLIEAEDWHGFIAYARAAIPRIERAHKQLEARGL